MIKKKLFFIFCICCVQQSYASLIEDSSVFYFSRGIIEKNAKRYISASAYFDKAITFNKNYKEAYIENGFANKEMRKTEQAKSYFLKAYELQPSNNLIINELTEYYYNYRQWDKAIEFAKKNVGNDKAERIIGLCNYEKENYLEAEKALLKVLSKTPEDANVNYILARTYMDMEQFRKALLFFEIATGLKPENNVWAYELGLLYYSNNNFRSAVTSFENATINGYPVSNDFNENYGYALLYSGQYAKGEEKLFGIYLKKGNIEMLRDLAQILYEQKQYKQSLNYCQRLLETNAKDAKALYQAGLCFLKMGQKEKGEGMCNKAIEMDPSLASKRTKSMDIGGL